MAYFSAAPTLCEVIYDKNTEDRHTPYRFQCRSANTRIGTGSLSPTFTDTANFSLPSGYNVSYYEYLRTLYDSRISSPTKTSGYQGSGVSPGHQSARNFYGHPSYPTNLSTQDGRPKTASPFTERDHRSSSYPHSSALPFIRHGWGPPGGEDDDGSGDGHKGLEDRLQWVDALNKWIPEHNQNRPGYLTFVGNAPMVDKILREVHAQRERERELQRTREICERYEQHMTGLEHRVKSQSKPLNPENSFAHRFMTLKKREALRKKANEMLELRRQQRSQGSSASDRRHKVRFQTPNYQPKPKAYSPAPREPVNVPKDVPDLDIAESEVSSHVTQSDLDTTRSKLPEIEPEEHQVEEEEKIEEEKESPREKMLVEPSITNLEEDDTAKEVKSAASLLPQIAMETVEKSEIMEPEESKKPQKKKRVVLNVSEDVDGQKSESLPEIGPKIDQSPDSKKPKKSTSKTGTKSKSSGETKSKRSKSKAKEAKQTSKAAKQVRDKPEGSVRHAQTKWSTNDIGTNASPRGNAHDPVTFLQIVEKRGEKEEEVEHVHVLEEVQSIPTIGDNKTGPLSLTGGRESPVKKTREVPPPIPEEAPPVIICEPREPVIPRIPSVPRRVSIDEIQKKRRASLFAKKKAPSPPPLPTPPRTPTPPPVEPVVVEEEPPPEVQTAIDLPVVDIAEPALPDPSTFLKQTTSGSKVKKVALTTPIVKLQQKLQRKKFQRDTSYEDELRRQELAEKRKQKQMEMLERMKNKRGQMGTDIYEDDGMPSFEDYGFLAKYCIFNKANIEMYKHTFDAVDDEGRGWLTGIETMIALRGVNHKLTMHQEEYLYRIMELTGYNVSKGADFKLFSVLAALSQRITALDNWMKNLIGAMDWGTLEMKMFMCKTLWECNVDKDTNKISLDQLCVELRAGGVSLKHENEVREKLRHLDALDLLDFLTYVPLFIMIHEAVVDNPLSDVRDK